MSDVTIINTRPGRWVELPFDTDGPDYPEYRRQQEAIRAASQEGDERYRGSLKQARTELSWDCPCGERHTTSFGDWGAIEAVQYRIRERTMDEVNGNEDWSAAAAHVLLSGSFATYANVTCPATLEKHRICLSSGIPG